MSKIQLKGFKFFKKDRAEPLEQPVKSSCLLTNVYFLFAALFSRILINELPDHGESDTFFRFILFISSWSLASLVYYILKSEINFLFVPFKYRYIVKGIFSIVVFFTMCLLAPLIILFLVFATLAF